MTDLQARPPNAFGMGCYSLDSKSTSMKKGRSHANLDGNRPWGVREEETSS